MTNSKLNLVPTTEKMSSMSEAALISYHKKNDIGADMEALKLFWENFRESRGEERELKGTMVYDQDSNPRFIKG